MRRLIWMALLGATMCSAQESAKTTSIIGGVVTDGSVIAHPVRPPDKPCDARYEYSVIGADEKGYKEVCAPILRTVTEKEWQELMARLRELKTTSAPARRWRTMSETSDMQVVRWGALWRDKERQHIMFENCLPVVFLTRRKAQEWIDAKYGYMRKPEYRYLRYEPFRWRLPISIKVQIKGIRGGTPAKMR